MNRPVRQVLRATVATATAAVLGVGLLASQAHAAENTWIKNKSSGNCVTVRGEHDIRALSCNQNDRSQLWDRRGQTIRWAYTGHCLDSNGSGDVYVIACNGGDHQRWTYDSAGAVRNVATGRYLIQRTGYIWVRTSDGPANRMHWEFFGGE